MEIYYTPTAGLLNDPRLYSTVRVSLVDINTNEVIEALYDEAAQYEKCIASAMAAFQPMKIGSSKRFSPLALQYVLWEMNCMQFWN